MQQRQTHFKITLARTLAKKGAIKIDSETAAMAASLGAQPGVRDARSEA